MSIKDQVCHYYTDKLRTFGPTAKGMDWRDESSQFMRFEQLLRNCDVKNIRSLNDFGCGSGALLQYLRAKNIDPAYTGVDWCADMVETARSINTGYPNSTFVLGDRFPGPSDFTVASGVFNVRLDFPANQWTKFVESVLVHLNDSSLRGFAFNMLTSYSDPDKMRPDLFYADPAIYFDYCRRNFSKYVSLFHDYPLYEFTITVNK